MDAADFYSGIVVDVYARLKSSAFDPAPYAAFVRRHGEPALEVGCGDGEPMLELCAAGLEVDGVDSSLDMVKRCRENAARRGLTTHVFHQRVEDLRLDRRYRAVYFAGPTFNLLADDRTALEALVRIGEHLTDDGVALVPLWVPGPTGAEELGVTRVSDGGPGVELRYTPTSETYEPERRTRITAARYERVADGRVEVADREWVVHWQTPESMLRLCEAAGLAVVAMVDDDTQAAADDTSTSFTVTLRRSPALG